MRVVALIFAFTCLLGSYACSHTNAGPKALAEKAPERTASKSSAPPDTATAVPIDASQNQASNAGRVTAKVDFPTQIKPILEARCQPCHFSGGKVYQKMPFDRPETIKSLGTKLFTRIKDENERRLIGEFLAQQ